MGGLCSSPQQSDDSSATTTDVPPDGQHTNTNGTAPTEKPKDKTKKAKEKPKKKKGLEKFEIVITPATDERLEGHIGKPNPEEPAQDIAPPSQAAPLEKDKDTDYNDKKGGEGSEGGSGQKDEQDDGDGMVVSTKDEDLAPADQPVNPAGYTSPAPAPN
eukprot:g34282.t1